MAKRGASGLSGILAIDKPAGMTSHDVVNRVRRVFGEKRVGHAGTLDPGATGVLVVAVGPATRLVDLLHAEAKSYEARIVFGSETDTCDAAGSLTATAPVPDEVADPFFAQGFVASLVGEHEQMPPAYSAIKVDGVPAHRLARKGEEVALQPRTISVLGARLTGLSVDDSGITWDVVFDVSKGTYIRSLARDIGRALDSCAHLGSLRRTASGAITLDDCVTLEQLDSSEDPTSVFLDPVTALDLPILRLDGDRADDISFGRPLPPDDRFEAGESVSIVGPGGLRGVYVSTPKGLTPRIVFSTPVTIPAAAHRAEVIRLDSVPAHIGPAVIALGVFDGVHLGHRALLDAAFADARERGVKSVALTFEPDPEQVLSPEPAPLLMSHGQRIEALSASGVDVVAVVAFDESVASLTGDEFLESVVSRFTEPVAFHVGEDFRFGEGGASNVTTLREWAAAHDAEVVAHPLLSAEGAPISATRIREAVGAGDLPLAERLLGHPYVLRGIVRRGRGEGGRLLGFPTANIELDEKQQLPPDGSYASFAVIDDVTYAAATSIGIPPTFATASHVIEAHIIDFDGDIYGESIDVALIEHLRPMERFDTIEELKVRIAEDVERTRGIASSRR